MAYVKTGWDVPQDERDAVMLLGSLVRRIRKYEADERIKKMGEKTENWLARYNAKYPTRMLRGDAVLSDN